MSAETLERSVLEGKDREQLVAIAQALGVKSVSRAKKADLIGKILEQTGSGPSSGDDRQADAVGGASRRGADPGADADAPGTQASSPIADTPGATTRPDDEVVLGPDGEPLPEWEVALLAQGVATEATEAPAPVPASAPAASSQSNTQSSTQSNPQAPARFESDRDGSLPLGCRPSVTTTVLPAHPHPHPGRRRLAPHRPRRRPDDRRHCSDRSRSVRGSCR